MSKLTPLNCIIVFKMYLWFWQGDNTFIGRARSSLNIDRVKPDAFLLVHIGQGTYAGHEFRAPIVSIVVARLTCYTFFGDNFETRQNSNGTYIQLNFTTSDFLLEFLTKVRCSGTFWWRFLTKFDKIASILWLFKLNFRR